ARHETRDGKHSRLHVTRHLLGRRYDQFPLDMGFFGIIIGVQIMPDWEAMNEGSTMTIRPRRTVAVVLMALVLLAHVTPPAYAQSGPLYFPATGHFLTDDQGFLSFWRVHDGEWLLGFPIAEASVGEGGAAQYFERGRLEQQIDPASGASVVRTAAVGSEYAQALWRRFAPAPPRKA